MGGYGALKCALTLPEQYCNCGAFSSAADIVNLTQMLKTREEENQLIEFTTIFGDLDNISDDDDLFALATHASKLSKESLPRFFMTCGLSDGLLDVNRKLSSHMTDLDFDLLYKEWEGEHNWEFWDQSIKMTLEYFYR
jgi:S-formylglutathione hydrolase FrmB